MKKDLTQDLSQVPPQAIEIEEAVLGALLIEKEAIAEVIDLLQPDYFYKPAHQEIYRAAFTLFAQAEPIDLLTVSQELRRQGKLELAGGAKYLMQVTSSVNAATNIQHHARIIIEQAIRRKLIGVCSTTRRKAFDETSDIFDLVEYIAQQLLELAVTGTQGRGQDLNSITSKMMANLMETMQKPESNRLIGVSSGLNSLDRIIGGFQKANVTILAARPAMGKTAFALNISLNAAQSGVNTAFFSLEMGAEHLVFRLISMLSGIEVKKLKNCQLSKQEVEQVIATTNSLNKLNIHIDDTANLSIIELRSKLRRLVFSKGVKLVVIDYLQLMNGVTRRAQENRQQEIANIARALKNIANNLNIPIIALSQINRGVESRADKRPMMSDLRESGEIEQSADNVLFLYRPAYYGITTDNLGNPTQGITEVIVAKCRDGSTDTALLKFIAKYQVFKDFEAELSSSSNTQSI